MLKLLFTIITFRYCKARKLLKGLLYNLEAKATEDILQHLFYIMRLTFFFSKSYRQNIIDFNGKYTFQTADKKVLASIHFQNNSIHITEASIQEPDVIFTFKTPADIINYIFSSEPNMLNIILEQRVVIDGNFNYMYKLGYMAQSLKKIYLGPFA